MLTEEQYKKLDKHIDTIELIIRNSAISNVSVEYKATINEIGRQLGYRYCTNCNAGIYNLTAQLYNKYIEYRNAKTKTTTRNRKGNRNNKK